MKISVIIPTYNEERSIQDCLGSLDKQKYSDFEVIVVDDGSTDETMERVNSFSSRNFQLRVLKQKHKGAGAARNLGASEAHGDILVFVDADMTFERVFLRKLVAPIVAGKAGGTFSGEEFVSNWENVWSRSWNINEGWKERRRHKKIDLNSQKVFRAIKKSLFVKAGGFAPGGYSDDYSLSEKLGFEAVLAEGARFYHKNTDRLIDVFKQARWVGKRNYKFGFLGVIFALFRASLPISLVMGSFKAIWRKELRFVIFKVVYDLGIFAGLVEYKLFGKGAK
jgi:glycosyltransferase involved in cell wall biosynthesis